MSEQNNYGTRFPFIVAKLLIVFLNAMPIITLSTFCQSRMFEDRDVAFLQIIIIGSIVTTAPCLPSGFLDCFYGVRTMNATKSFAW